MGLKILWNSRHLLLKQLKPLAHCFNLFLDFEIESNLCLFESGSFGGVQCNLLFYSFDQTIYFDVVNVLRVTSYVDLSAVLGTITHGPELKSKK